MQATGMKDITLIELRTYEAWNQAIRNIPFNRIDPLKNKKKPYEYSTVG